MTKQTDWREDSGLISTTSYRRKYALFPKICSDGTKVWLKYYYSKYITWGHRRSTSVYDGHVDFIENITEAEYIVRKITEGF